MKSQEPHFKPKSPLFLTLHLQDISFIGDTTIRIIISKSTKQLLIIPDLIVTVNRVDSRLTVINSFQTRFFFLEEAPHLAPSLYPMQVRWGTVVMSLFNMSSHLRFRLGLGLGLGLRLRLGLGLRLAQMLTLILTLIQTLNRLISIF